MKIDECIKIAKACGLTRLEEAYLNIKLHSICIFTPDSIEDELNELKENVNKLLESGFSLEDKLSDIEEYLNKEDL